MGPKKKEEEIDLSTLPECKSINVIILCRGRKARAVAIQQRLQKECEKFLTRVRKSEVLDHAKEKSIYIDPNTLTDKQKKDTKFMETVNTELTAQVIAKAVKSLLTTLSVKVRIQKKNAGDKPAQEKGRKYDVMYVFEDLPDTTNEFEELAKCGENVKYVLVIDPKVSWVNAPEMPEQNEQEEEEDEEIKEYKQLLKKEAITAQDAEHEAQVDKRIAHIKQLRSQSKPDSQFRNCTISVVEGQIDPYNEENSLGELVKNFLESINKLNTDVTEFYEWKKDKHAQSIGEPVKVEHQPVEGRTVLSLLDNLAHALDEQAPTQTEALSDEEEIMNLINGFSTSGNVKPLSNSNVSSYDNEKPQVFVGSNDYVGEDMKLLSEVRKYIKFPGINRFQMPEIPSKSEKLRKLLQSQYALFLNKQLDLNQFLRRQQILNFEEYIKEFDQQRTYNFTDRIYEQHHDKPSLERELYRALEFNEYSTFTKYDENSDKMYVMLVYKNNPRRVNRKLWESNWKVIPNYQSWLKYFKSNENNLINTQFFDIDYEKIGNIQENTRCFTLNNGVSGAVIINKECAVSNSKQSLLYAIKKNFLFGVQNGKFFSENGKVRIYHLGNAQSKSYETVILLPNCRIRLVSDGNVLIEKGDSTRLITPSGYTIIYGKEGSTILHPTGGITYNHNTYTNESGYGLNNGNLFASPTLKRKVDHGQIIKRDDNTVIANTLQNGNVTQKWIKFYEGTQYQVTKNKICIEKQGEPFVICQNGNLRIVSDQLTIRITSRKEGYTTVVEFLDGNHLRILKQHLYVFQVDEEGEIAINIKNNQIGSKFGNEELKVNFNESIYIKNNKKFDARQEEEKYGEDDVLPADYIEPRLFVVSNENTGVQLISEKMYNEYLKENEGKIERVYENKVNSYTQCHLVAKQDKKKGKKIKNSLFVNLDVFDNTSQVNQEPTHSYISLKTYLRYDPLAPASVNQLHKIKSDIQAWRKQNAKEENEFGHREPNDPATKGKIQAKLLTIKKRQERQPRVKCESLRETAKNFHQTTYEQIRKQLERESREKQLRTQFMKKKNSIVQEYKKINVNQQGRRSLDPTEVVQEFMDHYFMTSEGKLALTQMPQWVFRPKEIKAPVELDPEIQNELNNTNNLNKEQESEEQRERYDTVEVNLNPKPEKEIYIKPSVFTQREIDEERSAFQHEKKAYKYHEAKRKDFNVLGQERKKKPEVPSLLRTQPISEINQKYLVTEAPLDRKVKISSMTHKFTSNASSLVQMRKEGPHSLLLRTIDKGNDINKMLERRTMMVQADLNDKLQRDILINPIEANFGVIMQRKAYQLKIDIKNEDLLPQRLTIGRPSSIYVKAVLQQTGPIALGMTRKIKVTIRASPQIIGKFNDQFYIKTKHEIYHIPIIAHVISEGQSRNESLALNRGVTEVEEVHKKKQSSYQLPRITK